MQAPPPCPPAVLTGPRLRPRGGVRSPGDTSGARKARARGAAAASGPRTAAAATALSRYRPRRPPPRARPLAPPRPEPPPGPPAPPPSPSALCLSLALRPPSLSVPARPLCTGLGPRARRPRPTGRPVGPLGRREGLGPEAPAPHAPERGEFQVEAPGVAGQMALPAKTLEQKKITGVPLLPLVGPRGLKPCRSHVCPAFGGPHSLIDPAGQPRVVSRLPCPLGSPCASAQPAEEDSSGGSPRPVTRLRGPVCAAEKALGPLCSGTFRRPHS